MMWRWQKWLLRLGIRWQEARIRRLASWLIVAQTKLNHLQAAYVPSYRATYLLRVQEMRVQGLKADLKEARAKLQESQEVYVRAYVSTYWRGKDITAHFKESE